MLTSLKCQMSIFFSTILGFFVITERNAVLKCLMGSNCSLVQLNSECVSRGRWSSLGPFFALEWVRLHG